ncbi:MAG: DinB family protein [Saprospiraceae bacterium]
MTNQSFLNEIKSIYQNNQTLIKTTLEGLTENDLNKKVNPESWSILECLEHLNIYARYYQPAITKALQKASKSNSNTTYSNGWFGKMSIDGIKPSNTKKQKTLKKYNPTTSQLSLSVVDEFWQNNAKWEEIIEMSFTIDINQRAVPVEFLKLIKMKIGDALCFAIQHEARHIQQISTIKKEIV